MDISINLVKDASDVKIIKLEGVLDTLTAVKLDAFMSGLMRKENICIVVDCSGLTYINSSGLASLMLYHIQAKRRQSAFKLLAPSDFARDIIDASGAKLLWDIYDTAEAAVKDWESSRKNL